MEAQQEENICYVMVNDLRIGHYIIINDGACVINSISVSKTGKHGSAKAHIVARNIFTDKRVENIYSTSEMVKCPIVTKNQYSVTNIESDGNIMLLSEDMEEVYGLVRLENNDVCLKLKTMFEENKQITVSVISAMGNAKIFDCTEEKEK
jgi:translation initiation factor 5A